MGWNRSKIRWNAGKLEWNRLANLPCERLFNLPGHNCKLWLAPFSSISTRTWRNLVQGGSDVVQATAANQPTRIKNARSGYSSFDGTDDFLAQKVLATVSTGTFLFVSVDGQATIYSSATDLSQYVGKFIRIKDTAGKYAWAYGYAADGAEALGDELVTNSDCELDSLPSLVTSSSGNVTTSRSNEQAHGGTFSLKVVSTSATPNTHRYTSMEDLANAIIVIGALYKQSAWAYYPTGQVGGKLIIYGMGNTGGVELSASDAWQNAIQYRNVRAAVNATYRSLYYSSDIGTYWYLDDDSIKRVTALGATALQLVSANGGSTRNLTGQQSGFNYNSISTVEVLEPDFNITGALTLLAWVKPSDGQPAAAQSIVSKWDTTVLEGFALQLTTAGKLKAVLTHDGATDWDHTTDGAVYADGAQAGFSSIGFVFDASANIDVFVSGAEVASTLTGTGQNTLYHTPASLRLGADVDGNYFDGSIATVMIFSQKMGAAEVKRVNRIGRSIFRL